MSDIACWTYWSLAGKIGNENKKLSYRWQTARRCFVKLLRYCRTFCQKSRQEVHNRLQRSISCTMKVCIEVLQLASRLNLKYLRRFIFLLFLPHFCFPWGRPRGNQAKCCMDGKIIRCLQIVSQHVPIYLQQFPSYSNRKCKKSPF